MASKQKQTTKPGASRKSGKRHSRAGKKILFFLFVLVVLCILLVMFAPEPEPEATTMDTADWIQGLELPAPVPGEQIISHTGYTLSYNEEYEQPSYVAYLLTRDKIYGALDRADNFRADPTVTTGSAPPDDYRSSGYDRGHLCPAADQKWSAQAMDDSFYMSNMSPQVPAFNRGIWGSLEATVRTFANDYGAVYVATGPVLTDGPYKTIGANKVAVPKEYYKAILAYDGKENAKAIGFLLPNEGSKKKVQDYACSIDDLELKTGLDFFPKLDDNIEMTVEDSYSLKDWDWREFSAKDEPKTLVAGTKADDKRSESIKQVILVVASELRKQLVTWINTL